MKVSELIRELERYPEDMEVVMATDQEGNSFSEIYELTEDEGNCIVLEVGATGDLDEIIEDYEYNDEEED